MLSVNCQEFSQRLSRFACVNKNCTPDFHSLELAFILQFQKYFWTLCICLTSAFPENNATLWKFSVWFQLSSYSWQYYNRATNFSRLHNSSRYSCLLSTRFLLVVAHCSCCCLLFCCVRNNCFIRKTGVDNIFAVEVKDRRLHTAVSERVTIHIKKIICKL
jgi:hypothetical protein